jgi:hypothetical protein
MTTLSEAFAAQWCVEAGCSGAGGGRKDLGPRAAGDVRISWAVTPFREGVAVKSLRSLGGSGAALAQYVGHGGRSTAFVRGTTTPSQVLHVAAGLDTSCSTATVRERSWPLVPTLQDRSLTVTVP